MTETRTLTQLLAKTAVLQQHAFSAAAMDIADRFKKKFRESCGGSLRHTVTWASFWSH